jgi:hypothetical protein
MYTPTELVIPTGEPALFAGSEWRDLSSNSRHGTTLFVAYA